MKLRKSEQGFTLVELAIVMTIIGLLIGGILKGQELMENARVTATVAQVRAYEAALTTFRDTYGALPGDLLNANDRLPGCTAGAAAGTECSAVIAGLGNGAVGDRTTANTATNEAGLENTMFWTHLQLTNLISGVSLDPVNRGADTDTVDFGDALPTARIGGGFRAGSSDGTSATSNNVPGGLNLLLVAGAGVDIDDASTSAGVIAPLRAEQIDTKMDDGSPTSGSVTAHGLGASCGGIDYGANGVLGGGDDTVFGDSYVVGVPSNDCGLIFRLL